MEENNNTNNPHYESFKFDEEWCEKFQNWSDGMDGGDCGELYAEFTNSVYAHFMFDSAHYGYNRRQHADLSRRFDLDYNNACLIKYEIRQSDYELGPSENYIDFIENHLVKSGFHYLGTTSSDEYGTYLRYWFVKEYGEVKSKEVGDDYEPYDRWSDENYDYEDEC